MKTVSYESAAGVRVVRTATPLNPTLLDGLIDAVEQRRGGILSSGMEYPGRYSRWHVGYVDPCAEVVARGRRITVTALNRRGRVVLPAIARAVLRVGTRVTETDELIEVEVPQPDEAAPEELRSRRLTVFSALREIIATFAPPGDAKGEDTALGLYGAFGYDLAFQFEPITQRHTRPAGQRDLVLHLPDEILVHDRKLNSCEAVRYEFEVDGASTEGMERTGEPTPRAAPGPLPPAPEVGSYAAIVERAKERFARGDLFEVVPSHVMYAPCPSVGGFFARLRSANPAPYEFMFNLGEDEYLVGASPEMFVRVRGDRVETCPISGTIKRGATPLEDAENIRTLLDSRKDESELTMCTDVDRNDKSRVCVPGSVRVIGRRQVEMYSRLIHTVDHIEGRLRPDLDALDAFLTHMWAVTVTGAPKNWAMQFIEDHETGPRQWYGGAVGQLGFDGSVNTGLTLRTAHIRSGIAAVRAGATLLHDSDPMAEEQETHLKARALIETLTEAAQVAQVPADLDVERPRPGEGMNVLVVDHQDSFVNTLADYFRQTGADVTTLRFGFDTRILDELAPDLVVLSPGPGKPRDFDCASLLDALADTGIATFGVCLGLQAMVEHSGGRLALTAPQHGKPTTIRRDGGELLRGLDAEFTAARYHSLHAATVAGGFAVTARSDDGIVMAIEDASTGRWAVQFHPESILTASGGAGHRIIRNVVALARERAARSLTAP